MPQETAFQRFFTRIGAHLAPHFTVKPTTQCPICGSTDTRSIGSNTLQNGKACRVHQCSACTHKFCAPIPAKEVVQSWYQGMVYFEKNCCHQGITSIEMSSQWNGFVSARLKVFNERVVPKFPAGKRLDVIEIGCLEGMLLKQLSLQGHNVIGFEANAEVVVATRDANGIDVRVCNIETDDPQGQADVVLAFHVFEHLCDPFAATGKVQRMLRPGGVVVLELPCDDDEMNNPDHFHFFTSDSTQRLMKAFFVDVEIVPSFYIRNGQQLLGSLYAIGHRV